MAGILVVCTGNVCRSPIAEGILRSFLDHRFGDAAPSVASAGTGGWVGSRADPSSVAAAIELGVDISAHRARRLEAGDVANATLVLAMASEHRASVAGLGPSAAAKTFTLKELVRLLEKLGREPPPGEPDRVLADRVTEAHAFRSHGTLDHTRHEDVADPLGMPLEDFRAVASDLERWCGRLTDVLFGRTPARVITAPEGN
jgi:protein-tyrosine phosphatase